MGVIRGAAFGPPREIRVGFHNVSKRRGWLLVPDAMRAGDHYLQSAPAMAIIVRQSDKRELRFVYARRKGYPVAAPAKVWIDAGASVLREYPTSSFSLIGDLPTVDPETNFFTCIDAGRDDHELVAALVLDWQTHQQMESNAFHFLAAPASRITHRGQAK